MLTDPGPSSLLEDVVRVKGLSEAGCSSLLLLWTCCKEAEMAAAGLLPPDCWTGCSGLLLRRSGLCGGDPVWMALLLAAAVVAARGKVAALVAAALACWKGARPRGLGLDA